MIKLTNNKKFLSYNILNFINLLFISIEYNLNHYNIIKPQKTKTNLISSINFTSAFKKMPAPTLAKLTLSKLSCDHRASYRRQL